MLGLFAVAACGERIALDRAGSAGIRRIGVVTPAVSAAPSAPTTMPISIAFGSIGGFVDLSLKAERDRALARALAADGYRAWERWPEHLMFALAAGGFVPVEVPATRFGLEFLPHPPPAAVDAYLDTVVPEYGFVADLPDRTFIPFAAAAVRLSAPDGRALFQDQIVMNTMRPFEMESVAGPDMPRFEGPAGLVLSPADVAAGVDAALRAMAEAVVARLR